MSPRGWESPGWVCVGVFIIPQHDSMTRWLRLQLVTLTNRNSLLKKTTLSPWWSFFFHERLKRRRKESFIQGHTIHIHRSLVIQSCVLTASVEKEDRRLTGTHYLWINSWAVMGCVGGLWVLRFRRDPDDVEEVCWGYNNTLSHLQTLTGVHSTTSRQRGQSFMVSYYVFHNDEVDVKRRQKDIPFPFPLMASNKQTSWR